MNTRPRLLYLTLSYVIDSCYITVRIKSSLSSATFLINRDTST